MTRMLPTGLLALGFVGGQALAQGVAPANPEWIMASMPKGTVLLFEPPVKSFTDWKTCGTVELKLKDGTEHPVECLRKD